MNPTDRLQTSGEGRSGRFQTFSALRHKDYRYLWISSIFIGAGNGVQQIALGWLVLVELDQSPLWVGIVLGIRALPILLVGPLAGVAVDRLDRKKLFLAAQLGLVIIAFLFALDVHLGKVTVIHALIFSFLLGLDAALNNPVRQSLIVNTVVREDLDLLGSVYAELTLKQRQARKKYFDNTQDLAVEINKVRIAVRGSEAVVSYTREDQFTDSRTGKTVKLDVRLTKMLRRVDGTWKMASAKK